MEVRRNALDTHQRPAKSILALLGEDSVSPKRTQEFFLADFTTLLDKDGSMDFLEAWLASK